jgi:hypothetical protein
MLKLSNNANMLVDQYNNVSQVVGGRCSKSTLRWTISQTMKQK